VRSKQSGIRATHLELAVLNQFVADPQSLTASQAAHLAACAACRHQLAQRDPSAVFGLLGPLAELEALPHSAVPSAPRIAQLRARATRRPLAARADQRRWWFAAAAAVAAVVVIVSVTRPRPELPEQVAMTPMPTVVSPLIERVMSRTARVLQVVPASEGASAVALIVDEGVEL
jgi:hypothetical protein